MNTNDLNSTVTFVNSNKTFPDNCSTNIATSHLEKSNQYSKYISLISNHKNLIFAILSSFLITVSIFTIKLSVSLNASEMAFAASFIQLLISLAFSYIFEKSLTNQSKESWFSLLWFSLSSSISLIALYISIKIIDFNESISIRYISSIITIILAGCTILRKVENFKSTSFILNLTTMILSSILAIVGVVFIARPSFIFNSLSHSRYVETSFYFHFAILLSILSATLISISFTFIKKLNQLDAVGFCVVNFYASLASIVILLILALFHFLFFNTNSSRDFKQYIYRDISLALLSALTGYAGKHFFFKILPKLNQQKLAFLNITDLIVSFFLDFFILNTVLNVLTFLGCGFILFGVLLLVLHEFIVNKLKFDKMNDYCEERY